MPRRGGKFGSAKNWVNSGSIRTVDQEGNEMKIFHAQERDGNNSRTTFWNDSMGGMCMSVVLEG